LPDVVDGTTRGKLALRVRGKLMAFVAIHRSAEPETLAVRIDFEQRAGLLSEAPETYYLTEHYRSYPVVLVRLSQLPIDQIRDLLSASWRFVTSSSSKNQRSAGQPGKAVSPRPKRRSGR
jgi:hypothetical protein